jgi:hypothetical protein
VFLLAEKSDINSLRAYFNSLKTFQKREFIQKLQKKLDGVKSDKHQAFLLECIGSYNNEVKAKKKDAEKKEARPPDISAESFALALASMLAGARAETPAPAIGPRLIGTWQREDKGKAFYVVFHDDGVFETNENKNNEKLKGHFKIGMDNAVLLEPHDLTQINSLTLSVSGRNLTLGFADGRVYDYRRSQA